MESLLNLHVPFKSKWCGAHYAFVSTKVSLPHGQSMRAALARALALAAAPRPLRTPSLPLRRRPMTTRLSTAVGASDAPLSLARRRQEHLEVGDAAPDSASATASEAAAARGGPGTLDKLQLHVLARSDKFVVLNKGADERLDGAFDVTIEKAVCAPPRRRFRPGRCFMCVDSRI
jgi:hypothetical protein